MKKLLSLIAISLTTLIASAQFTVYNVSNSDITDNSIWDVECDALGNVWLSSLTGGIFKSTAPAYSSWTVYTTTNSQLSDNVVCGLKAGANGTVWAGTQNTGFNYFNGTVWTPYTVANSDLPANTVYHIIDGPGGVKYIPTKGGGLSIFNGTVFTNFDDDDGLVSSNNRLYSVAYNSTNGDIWVAPEDKGIQKFTGTVFTTNYKTTNSPLPSDKVYYMYYDQHDDLWMCTFNGLAKFDGTNWEAYTTANSQIPGSFVRQVKMDADGIHLYVATTTGFGILNTQTDTWVNYTMANSNLPHDNCYSVDIDSEGDVLIGTYGGGLAKMDKPTSIKETSLSSIGSISPNPSSGTFNLSLKTEFPLGLVTLEIFSTTGQLIQSSSFNSSTTVLKKEFDLNVAKGVYTLRMAAQGKTYTEKFVVN